MKVNIFMFTAERLTVPLLTNLNQRKTIDYLLFVIMNANSESQWVQLPPSRDALRWARVVDTSLPAGEDFLDPGREVTIDPSDHYIANPRSVVVLVAR